MTKVRVALVQISFQPALALNHIAYLEEPIPPPAKQPQSLSLSGLAAHGLNVLAMQSFCRERYIAWSRTRVESVLAYLSSLQPVPDLVLFPEASIPLNVLPTIFEWAKKHGTTVLAGTHTPQIHAAGRAFYVDSGVSRADVKAIGSWNAENVLPVVQSDRTRVYPKTLLSVHELTDVAQPTTSSRKSRRPLTVATSGGSSTSITPLICSEALLDEGRFPKSDLYGVVSLEDNPARFSPWIQNQVAKRGIVLYCNGAQAGGSTIGVTSDHRHPNWFLEMFAGGLPPGEAILVADLDTDVTSVETGTAQPGNSLQLVALAGIVSSSPSELAASQAYLAACAELDPDVRTQQLGDVIAGAPKGGLLAMRAQRLQFDAARGHPSADAVAALGHQCNTNAPRLEDIQRELATACADRLPALIPAAGNNPEALRLLTNLIVHYNKHRVANVVPVSDAKPEQRGFVDREEERARLREFIDSKTSIVLAITGLPGVGKSALIRNGLEQLGIADTMWIALDEATSADFLFRKLTGDLVAAVPTTRAELQERIGRSLKRGQVVVLDGSRLNLDYDRWSEPDIENLVSALAGAAREKGAKIIVEANRRLSNAIEDLDGFERLFTTGLDKRKNKFGLQVLESQLRRMSLPADMVSHQAKEKIVSVLSGNPKALELAATACLDEGADAVIASLERGAGNLSTQIRRLLRVTRFSPMEESALALLSRARADVPRVIVPAALGGETSEYLGALIVSGAVEIGEGGLIGIATILRPHFSALAVQPPVEQRFHEGAARALAQSGDHELERRSAAEFHARMAGISIGTPRVALPDAALAVAHQRFEDQQYPRAAAVLNEILAVRPKWRPALRLAALTFARLKERAKALTSAKAAFLSDKRDPNLLHELSKIGLTQNDEFLLEGLIDIGEELGLPEMDILVLRGRLQLRRRQLRAAEGSFQRACELARDAWPFLFLGETYARMGRYEDAIEVFHEGDEKHERYRWHNKGPLYAIRTKLGLAYLFQGDLELAESWINSGSDDERKPEAARARAMLALIKEGVADLDKILDRLKLAKARSRHERSQVHLFAGEILLRFDRLEEAEQEFGRATEADRGLVHAWLQHARCSLEIARRRRAMVTLPQRSMRTAPTPLWRKYSLRTRHTRPQPRWRTRCMSTFPN